MTADVEGIEYTDIHEDAMFDKIVNPSPVLAVIAVAVTLVVLIGGLFLLVYLAKVVA